MSRRRQSSNRNSSDIAAPHASAKRKGWLGRLLTRASQAGLGGSSSTHYGMEALESRTMLTTFPTEISPTGTTITLPDPYYYLSGTGQVDAISYSSDVEFEALGAVANTGTLGDLVRYQPGALTNPTVGRNLFQIYVTQSTANSYISIYQVAISTDPLVITPTPYSGSVDVEGVDAITGNPHNALMPAGTGAVYIGSENTLVTPGPVPITTGSAGTGQNAPVISNPQLEPTPTDILPGIIVTATNTATGLPNNFGTFLVGGAVTGAVSFGANVGEFYAGDVLTGDIGGDPLVGEGTNPVPANFYVAGDLREFITTGPVGTDNSGSAAKPGYITHFDLTVGGKIGEVHLGNGGTANFAGTIEAGNSNYISTQTAYPTTSDANLTGYLGDQTEAENIPPKSNEGITSTWDTGELNLRNDTAADAQILGSVPVISASTGLPVRDIDGNIVYQADVDGILENFTGRQAQETDDYYGMALLAGQTVQVTLDGSIPSLEKIETEEPLEYPGLFTGDPVIDQATVNTYASTLSLQIIDPDGRVIASNSRSGIGAQQFTADRPGLYLFHVALGPLVNLDIPYALHITNTGTMAIGGIVVSGNMTDAGTDQGIQSGGGDIGVIDVRGVYASTTLGPLGATVLPSDSPQNAPASIVVASGNLRAVVATSIGTGTAGTPAAANGSGGTAGTFGDPLYLSVPNGNVGLIQATGAGAADVLVLSSQFDPNSTAPKTDDGYATAIGGDIQVIDAHSLFYGDIATNGGIGTIRAATMDTTTPSYIDVNADNKGFDGIIDLIDVTGQFGFLGGGPEIVTHDGGNVRYLDVTGDVFLPAAYGGEVDQAVTYPAGVSQTLTDDSGAIYTVTPNGPTTTTTVTNASTGTTTSVTTGPQLTTLTYPVMDKSGLIPISISSSGSLTVSASGTNGAISSLDIASLSFTGIGRAIEAATSQNSTGTLTTTTDANGNAQIIQPVPTGGAAGVVVGPLTDTTDEFLSLTGPANINVLNVTATTSVAGNSPVEISNTTRGEVVNITTPGIGSIVVNGNLGFATPVASAAAVMPRAVIQDGGTYPFVQQHTGVVIGTGFEPAGDNSSSAGSTGDAVSIKVGGAVGNINAGGTIQSLVAGASPITGEYNGIVGPIIATRLLLISDGQGILPTGTGSVGFAGLYATGKVGTVTGTGDIRGNIVSAADDASETGIDAITLSNASIIDNTIATIFDLVGHIPGFAETADVTNLPTIVSVNNLNFAPGAGPYDYDIGPITVSGDGGIIGSNIETGSVASITVNNGGFGIFDTKVFGQNSGRLGSITASGYGIRDSDFEAFAYIGAVTATGNGSLTPVTSFGLDVRPSDLTNKLDPFFGRTADVLIDLNANLGTTAATPNIANVTDTGVIQDDLFGGSRDFTSLTAQKYRTALPLFANATSPTNNTANIPVIGVTFANSITFGGVVGSINIKQVTDGLQITAGQLTKLSLGPSVNRFGLSVAGNINSLTIHGNLGQYITDPGTGQLVPDSYIDAGGINGTISSLKVLGNLNADVSATGSIGSILVTGYVLGTINSFANTGGLALGSLRVLGGLRNGALVLKGNVGSIIVNGGLGTSTGTLDITGNANLIEVGADRVSSANALALALTVEGTLKKLLVYGKITGSIHTLGDLTNLTVIGAGSSIITAPIQVDGRIGTATITNGDISSSIIAVGSIGSFTINHGSLLFGGTIESDIDAIRNFKITGGSNYGLFGSLLAPSGLNDNIDVSGNIGDGTDAAIITADSGNTFHIRGTIKTHSTITVTGVLNTLQVDNGIQTGATITALQIKKRKITGTNDGTIVAAIP